MRTALFWVITQRIVAIHCRRFGTTCRMRTALFWVITQRILGVPCRRFGTTCRSHLQGSIVLYGPIGFPKSRQGITTTRCLIAQKSAVFGKYSFHIMPSPASGVVFFRTKAAVGKTTTLEDRETEWSRACCEDTWQSNCT